MSEISSKELSFDELAGVSGGKQIIENPTSKDSNGTCPTCKGTGTVTFGRRPVPCPDCSGKKS